MATARRRGVTAACVVASALLAVRAATAAVETTTAAGEVTSAGPVTVAFVDDEVRLRRGDRTRVRAATGGPRGGLVRLAALRGETVAFQVVVIAETRDVGTAAVSVSSMLGATPAPVVQVFRQHYLTVERRSRNEARPRESLGWRAGAGPPDDDVMGQLPDALIPASLPMAAIAPGPSIPAGQLAAFWIDVAVPADAVPGTYRAEGEVVVDGARAATFTIGLDVKAPLLPYRAASVFAFYEPRRLAARLGDGDAVERQLWQLLHQHHVDALAPLSSAGDVDRLAAAFDGSLFGHEAGYRGPGPRVPPAVVALGAYGALGDPSPGAVIRVQQMAARLPGALTELFVYAVDEQCDSPRAADWKRALAGAARVHVGQTCAQPPGRQAADIAMIPAAEYARRYPAEARAGGRRAWIYNGTLPHTGAMLLDADPRGLIANGWIAALAAVERWFYWETTFWDDGNKGGRGPVDPFTTAENFHNADGDAALGDGLLLYPGRQTAPFDGSSLGYPGVLPSLRLKALRRGIQDAGYLALAAREQPDRTSRLAARVLPAMLDEAPPDGPPAWMGPGETGRFGRARDELRALITRTDPASPADVRRAFDELATRRAALVATAPDRRGRFFRVGAVVAATVAGAALVAMLAAVRRRRQTSR